MIEVEDFFQNRPEVIWVENLEAYVDTPRLLALQSSIALEEFRCAVDRGDVDDTPAGIDAFSDRFVFSRENRCFPVRCVDGDYRWSVGDAERDQISAASQSSSS